LGPVKQTVTDEKEEEAENDPRAQSLARRPLSFPECPAEENGPGKQMPDRGREQRGDRFDRVADCEEGRAPDHVDRKKGEDCLDPAGSHGLKSGGVGHSGALCHSRENLSDARPLDWFRNMTVKVPQSMGALDKLRSTENRT